MCKNTFEKVTPEKWYFPFFGGKVTRGAKIKWRLSPLRNYPAQSFAGREKRGGGAICTRINGTVAGTIQECGDLEETQDILRLLDVSNWAFWLAPSWYFVEKITRLTKYTAEKSCCSSWWELLFGPSSVNSSIYFNSVLASGREVNWTEERKRQ